MFFSEGWSIDNPFELPDLNSIIFIKDKYYYSGKYGKYVPCIFIWGPDIKKKQFSYLSNDSFYVLSLDKKIDLVTLCFIYSKRKLMNQKTIQNLLLKTLNNIYCINDQWMKLKILCMNAKLLNIGIR